MAPNPTSTTAVQPSELPPHARIALLTKICPYPSSIPWATDTTPAWLRRSSTSCMAWLAARATMTNANSSTIFPGDQRWMRWKFRRESLLSRSSRTLETVREHERTRHITLSQKRRGSDCKFCLHRDVRLVTAREGMARTGHAFPHGKPASDLKQYCKMSQNACRKILQFLVILN